MNNINELRNANLGARIANARRVLVAEDDPVTQKIEVGLIRDAGYEVVTANNGTDAMRILKQDNKFIAAVFDMMMPGCTGVDLINYMQSDARLRHIPAMMVTAETDPKVCEAGLSAGSVISVNKPFTSTCFKQMLNLLIDLGTRKQDKVA